MSNRIVHKVSMFILAILLVMGLMEYMHTIDGASLFAPVMGAYPFSKFIVGTITSALGYAEEIPLISNSSVLNDIGKLLISSILKAGVVSVLVGIFCTVPRFEKFSEADRIEMQQRYMNGFAYRLKVAVVNFFASILIVFISNEIIKYVYESLTKGGMTTVKTIGYLLIIVLIIVGYVFFVSQMASVSMGEGIFLAFVIKLLPGIVDVFVVNTICLFLYVTVYTNGFGGNAIGVIVGLFAWCFIADVAKSGIRNVFM